MCGIAGAVWSDSARAIDQATLERMTDTLRHRGPDDRNTFRGSSVDGQGRMHGAALGFRRLSIIDVEGARQPMQNEDASVTMVFNGEIYNFKSLRQGLEGAGHRFATHGDGESILHSYEDLGTDCFSKLNGMFAIALWDAKRHRLVLGRDRLGKKPLYYAIQNHRLLFASELKAFSVVDGWQPELDHDAIDEFLTYQYIPPPRTIWKNVFKLPPGHFAVYQNDRLTVSRYWDFDPSVERPINRDDAIDQTRALLHDSVKLRLQADVPLGAFLSGGIDSSLVVAIAQQQRSEPIRTFTVGFPDKDFDESGYAAEVAQHLGTQHTRFEVVPDCISIIDELVWHYDEPFGDSSAVPTWYLSKLTRGEVTVALSGDGGDELFAGYDRYRALWLSRLFQRALPFYRLPGISLVQKLPDSSRQRSFIRRAKRFLEVLGQDTARRYMNWLQIFPESLRAELYEPSFVESLSGEDPFEFLHRAWVRSGDRDVVTKASLADLETYLPCDLMTKVDIASMAHGLEVRTPMLDYRLVEFAASLPVSYKFKGSRGKLMLRNAFHDLLPSTVWTRKKMGFGVPLPGWLRGPLKPMVHDLLLGPSTRVLQFFKRDTMQRLIDEHETMRHNHSYRLWNLLILEKWLRRWN